MKKRFAVLVALLLLLSSVVTGVSGQTKQLNIVVTTFPLYDWTVNILGQRANEVSLTLLADSGVDLHNYQPTVKDFVMLSLADVFVYVGPTENLETR